MYSLLPLLLAIGVVPVWSFSLNTPTKYWNYTTASLSSTTSQECKDAYSANIDCDDFLLALAVSKEGRWWLPEYDSAMFDRTCTATCQSSLSAYVANVEKTCNKASDAAFKTNDLDDLGDKVFVPVVTLGHILQYALMRSCAKDDDGTYCYIGQSSTYYDDGGCDWTCALAYFWVCHEYPYDNYQFGIRMKGMTEDGQRVQLISSSVLFNDWQNSTYGWATVEKCGWTKNDTLPLYNMGMSKKVVEKQSTANSTAISTATSTATIAAASSTVKTAAPHAVSTDSGTGSIRMHIDTWMAAVILAIGIVVL
ncbi:hypothetical protein CNMCM6936_000758 [Aspergillus lentulus]|uniref:Uncharacterized protein n=1 Tax=Aspergillus lentulus TaxID=293939 RepID=A0AAN5YWW2_ASPLE|nr:hypothetical protein CNMCM6936_000758 [Aspergillus lentulus]KAF4179582.1 hypothetical protein CNMCM8060_002722 [Aspergillus lentulus]KAF4180223.1 hypothetical protein CNMCM7927_001418 [Aspergillus lentulus]KAF4197858.1 hypothetical protein CNMCM8694_001524 [Aspergillus lentulus]KAF4209204.1 hypothetical protein CNMCM8927_007571 [Aspergillus lentulus]